MQKNKHERGQAIILIVLGFVVILGFVGFAIDGGRVLGDRRHAQNSADSASLAGGGQAAHWLEDHQVNYANWDGCANGEIDNALQIAREAAVDLAAANGFSLDMDYSDYHGVDAECISEPFGAFELSYIDITVWITTETTGTFSSLLFPSQLVSRVESVARLWPRQPLAWGNAVVALNDAACQGQQNGANFHGNTDVIVEGGGIFSNGCLRANGNINVNVDGDEPGLVQYVAEVIGAGKFSDPVTPAPAPLPSETYNIPQPRCFDEEANNLSGDELLAASPLEAGLYCVSGDLRINGGDSLVSDGGVTIYMIDGEIRINGNATVKIWAPKFWPDPSPAVPGVLIYMAPGNDSNVQINGNSGSYFTGTIFAPDSNVNLLGTGALDAIRSQVIGWNVEAGGNNFTKVVFSEKENYNKPTSMDLNR